MLLLLKISSKNQEVFYHIIMEHDNSQSQHTQQQSTDTSVTSFDMFKYQKLPRQYKSIVKDYTNYFGPSSADVNELYRDTYNLISEFSCHFTTSKPSKYDTYMKIVCEYSENTYNKLFASIVYRLWPDHASSLDGWNMRTYVRSLEECSVISDHVGKLFGNTFTYNQFVIEIQRFIRNKLLKRICHANEFRFMITNTDFSDMNRQHQPLSSENLFDIDVIINTYFVTNPVPDVQ